MFKNFSKAVNAQIESFNGLLFKVKATSDDVWDLYLKSFSEGTDPIFKERTEHDCSCCKSFIRQMGNVVTLNSDGTYNTIWADHESLPHPYNVVSAALGEYIKSFSIDSVYMCTDNFKNPGQKVSRSQNEDGSVVTWDHFYGEVPTSAVIYNPDTVIGDYNTTAQMALRAVTSITDYAIDSVLDLINQGVLYRGEQYKNSIVSLKEMKQKYEKYVAAGNNESNFGFIEIKNPAARVRNTAIGTLLVDISEDRDIETAVKSYENMVAPANYQRPKALITPRMIKNALEKLDDLDMRDSIERRFAKTSDVSVKDVIWASADAQQEMKDSLEEILLGSGRVRRGSKVNDYVEIGINDFIKDIVPNVSTMDVMVHNALQSNFVALTAPVHADIKNMFSWSNNFAWSYNGGVADSIKERVKAAGGNVNAKLRVSLAWGNSDDLDLHCYTPNGTEIYFGNRNGVLDVDMNGGFVHNSTDPVENMAFDRLENGVYEFKVNQYYNRTPDNPGYTIQIAYDDITMTYNSAESPRESTKHDVLEVTVKGGNVIDVKAFLESNKASKEVWNVRTEELVPVTMLTYSPNHWDDNVGAKHYFFMLKGCKSPEAQRGFYNEFLAPELKEHRKVFEVLGSKTLCPYTDEQLAGLGFTAARNDEVKVHTPEGNYLVKF